MKGRIFFLKGIIGFIEKIGFLGGKICFLVFVFVMEGFVWLDFSKGIFGFLFGRFICMREIWCGFIMLIGWFLIFLFVGVILGLWFVKFCNWNMYIRWLLIEVFLVFCCFCFFCFVLMWFKNRIINWIFKVEICFVLWWKSGVFSVVER